MRLPTPKSATTPIPVQLSAHDLTAFILPHLALPKRGPQCTLGYHRLLNLILWVLYTGMQWKCLPIPTDAQGKSAIHYSWTNTASWYSNRLAAAAISLPAPRPNRVSTLLSIGCFLRRDYFLAVPRK
jgi:hypothetical protein